MKLLLLHGRKITDTNNEMTDWGFNGTTLFNVAALHVTYQATYVVHFKSKHDAYVAQSITGWPFFDDNALEMQFHQDDMVKTNEDCFGDYELVEDNFGEE